MIKEEIIISSNQLLTINPRARFEYEMRHVEPSWLQSSHSQEVRV